ncbi:MAG TPA: hypothetical protein VGC79_17255, partial [Polyangiaceae bacterium]
MLRAIASLSSVALVLCASCSSDGGPEPSPGGSILPPSAGRGGGSAGSPAIGASGGSSGGAGDAVGGASSGASGASIAGAAGLGGTVTGPSDTASKTAIEQLKAWLALAVESRPALVEQAFARVALTKADAALAQPLLSADYTAQLKATRAAEVGATESQAKTITAGGVKMKYYRAQRGQKPAAGWNLFISMHGGGNADAATNDSQWENQIALVDGYNPKNAIWVAPRAPSNEWNLWFRDEIDALFERLIADLIAFEGVDPNHVYLNGYSAGGDGAYQMGPRMADAWAGVG